MPSEALLFSLRFHKGRQSREDESTTGEVLASKNAQQGAGKFSALFFPPTILKKLKLTGMAEIGALDCRWKRAVERYTLPWGESTFLVPAAQYDRVCEINDAMAAERDALKARFINGELPLIRDTAHVWMGDLFDRAIFPDAVEMQRTIKVERSFLPLPSGTQVQLASLSGEAIEAIRQQTEERVQQAFQQGTKVAWRRLVSPMRHMIERLSQPDPRIYDTLTENIREIVQLIPSLNLAGDPDLSAFAQEVEQNLAGWDPDNFRNSATARKAAASEAQAILARWSEMGRRKFALAA